MKYCVQELQGPSLDWAVAKCEPDDTASIYFDENGEPICHDDWPDNQEFKPSTNWAQGGPIIEREGMHVDCLRQGNKPIWEAWPYATGTKHIQQGPTPLIAAMRCYVTSRLGDEIEIPTELSGV